jgi:toxin YoeB
LRTLVQNLEFDADAFEDLEWWVEHDRKVALKIIKLIQEIQRSPFDGKGQPEALKREVEYHGGNDTYGQSSCG